MNLGKGVPRRGRRKTRDVRKRLVDFLAWRANRGTYVRRQIEGLVNETTDPRGILSVAGILRSVFS